MGWMTSGHVLLEINEQFKANNENLSAFIFAIKRSRIYAIYTTICAIKLNNININIHINIWRKVSHVVCANIRMSDALNEEEEEKTPKQSKAKQMNDITIKLVNRLFRKKDAFNRWRPNDNEIIN